LLDGASRRKILFSVAGLVGAQFMSGAAYAEEEETVCKNPLGCEIPTKLAPPKRVFKDIFEEERELARQREEIAEKARAEQRVAVLKAVATNFEALKKGRNDLAKEVEEALGKVEANADDAAAWDDVRRMSRLYDTALRKDGMYPAADRIKKAKIDFDRKTSDELCKTLNSALKSLDAVAKKKDTAAARAKLGEALAAMDSWLALQPVAPP